MTGGTNIRPHLTIVKKQLLHTSGIKNDGYKVSRQDLLQLSVFKKKLL